MGRAEKEGKIELLPEDEQEWLEADSTGRRKELAYDPDKKQFSVGEAQPVLNAEEQGVLKPSPFKVPRRSARRGSCRVLAEFRRIERC